MRFRIGPTAAVALGGLGALALLASQIPGRRPDLVLCPWRRLTGTNCPGCGMTRALMALLRGDLDHALGMHPLSPVVLALIVATTALACWDLARGTDRFGRAWDRAALPTALLLTLALLVTWGWKGWAAEAP